MTNRFREHVLMKISRIRRFRILTNLFALIDCKSEVCSDFDLIKEKNDSRMRIVLDVMLDMLKICSFELFIEHAEQIVDREV